MGIDRIGRVGGRPDITPISNAPTEAVDGPTKFELGSTQETRETGAASPLARLRSGEINLNQYLDLQVEQSTAHLEGKLGAEQLDFVRRSLRIQLESDPMLAELVHSATSGIPPMNDGG